MTDASFQPWRTNDAAPCSLSTDADSHWSALLAESKSAIAQLRHLTEQVDHHVERSVVAMQQMRQPSEAAGQFSHEAVMQRLAAIESRIERIESQLAEPNHSIHPSVIPHAA